eukprot:745956-Hanusia_phi.AAC.5
MLSHRQGSTSLSPGPRTVTTCHSWAPSDFKPLNSLAETAAGPGGLDNSTPGGAGSGWPAGRAVPTGERTGPIDIFKIVD